MSSLKGQVAIVTGASRGVGKGIALALGERGATVYVSGRSEAGAATEGLAGTIGETADEVTRRGGRGVAVRCDHTVDADVERLFARVTAEAGRLDGRSSGRRSGNSPPFSGLVCSTLECARRSSRASLRRR
jgi:NAD(P)-dependent dehydrogenase (short-subunit alcohol dehydrogenase family)